MKKLWTVFLAALIVFTLGACGTQNQQNDAGMPEPDTEIADLLTETASMPESDTEIADLSYGNNGGKVLIVYFSYSGVTEGVSEMLKEKTGGDLFELLPVEPYSDDMYEASGRAAEELASGNLPEIIGELPDLSEYDTILVGGPVWSEKAAPPVTSYLSQTDFEGKKVAPFWTYNNNEGDYEKDVTGYIRNAEILSSLGMAHASSMEDVEMNQELDQWITAILGEDFVNTNETEIKIILTFGGEQVEAVLNDSTAAKEFQEMLPLTLSMTRMGEHEYYDALPQPLTHAEEVQTGYTVGDLAFWTPGDLFAMYFDEPEKAPEGLMILGRITSDLSVFDNFGNPEEVQIAIAKED